MAVSGTYTFNLTRNDIINQASINAGILDPEGGVLSSTQVDQMAMTLNTMVKAWQTLGLQIWTRKQIVIPLISGKGSYNLSPIVSDSAYQVNYQTTTTVAGTATNPTITVNDATGFASGTAISIQGASGTWQTTTVNGAPVANVITLTAALTQNVNSGARVLGGTQFTKPTRLLDGYLNQAGTGSDTPVRLIAKEEWYRFGQKNSTGTPVQIMYDPQLPYGVIQMYPVVNQAGNTLFLEAQCPFYDFSSATDSPDFPTEWLQALVWGLSYEICFQYGMTETRLAICEKARDQWMGFAGDSSQEGSVYMQPDFYSTQGWYGQ